MSVSKVLKWVTGALELLLGIPVLGGLIIIGTAYTPLFVMLILHIITLIISSKNNEVKYGSILGIVTSILAWIPFLGMVLHLVTAILLMVSAAHKEQPQQVMVVPPSNNSF
ncbi:hypothetical protein [Gorillibacterium sp. sgz500922]|uniref:hypothetical protein n=1 Tax=Gorillibacterium sp. sgz500922 TaxID=3446694 RepID=UPI003F66C0EA